MLTLFFYQSSADYDGGVLHANSNSNIVIQNSLFSRNSAKHSGGVMTLLSDSHITIIGSDFTYNDAVDAGGVISLQQSSLAIYNSTFNSSAAADSGGVIYTHNSLLTLKDSHFVNNSAERNGGVIDAHKGSTLTIFCCTFDNNMASTGQGGALNLIENCNTTLVDSNFEKNMVEGSGGAISLSISSYVGITKCVFISNVARIGAAVSVMQNSCASFINEEIVNEYYHNKTQIHNNVARFNGSIYLSSNSKMYFEEEIDIHHNSVGMFGGGIHAIDSFIIIGDTLLTFESNQAIFGGGLSLANSMILMHNGSDLGNTDSFIIFVLNQADYGGAIYVDDDKEPAAVCSSDSDLPTRVYQPRCFFYNITSGLKFKFKNNTAAVRGADLFGGLLDRCSVKSMNSSETEMNGTARFLNISSIEDFHTISSKAVRVCPCSRDNRPDCIQEVHAIQIERGKINVFTIQLAAVDQVGHPVAAMILSRFKNSIVSESQTVQTNPTTCSNVEFQVSFPRTANQYRLAVFVDGPCNDRSISSLTVDIDVIDCVCPPGFMPQENSTGCSCICDNKLSKQIKNLECNMNNESIRRVSDFWVKFLDDGDSSSNTTPYSYLVYPHCPFDYCKPPTVQTFIKLSESDGSDAQCSNNRGELLCGSCQSNYSLSLGSSKCVKCPTNWTRYGLPIGIILAALIAGIVLVVLILVLNLTVTVGTLNSIIFYANTIDVNRSIYFGQLRLTFIPIFISWLNLDIGFDTCFIEGMDTYYKTWFQLAFPAYIIFIVIAIIWISSCSSKFSNLIGKKDPVATLATLILLSYTKLLQTVITSFSFVYLRYPNGTRELRWLPDASIQFAAGKHIGLICVAISILMLGLTYTFLIFLWQWLLNTKCKWSRNQKLHYFIDTYHIPHSRKHRYWTGLLLLVRIITYIISSFSLSTDPRITLLSVVIIMCSLLLYKITFLVKAYKNWLLNTIDSFVLFNIAIFTIFTWFTHDDLNSKNKEILQAFVAYISVGIVIILTILIITFHIYRYGNAKIYSMGQNSVLAKKILNIHISEDVEHRDVRSRTNRFLYALDNPRKGRGYVPPPPKPTASVVTIEDCDQALTSNSQSNEETSKIRKLRAKSHIPSSDTRLSEFALLRKTEPHLTPHSELTSSLLTEEDEL